MIRRGRAVHERLPRQLAGAAVFEQILEILIVVETDNVHERAGNFGMAFFGDIPGPLIERQIYGKDRSSFRKTEVLRFIRKIVIQISPSDQPDKCLDGIHVGSDELSRVDDSSVFEN